MIAKFENASTQPPTPLPRGLLRLLAGFPWPRKAEPHRLAAPTAVLVPRGELERLTEISPHLLADIGVMPEASGGETSPWRLKDGRQLLLRPPL